MSEGERGLTCLSVPIPSYLCERAKESSPFIRPGLAGQEINYQERKGKNGSYRGTNDDLNGTVYWD